MTRRLFATRRALLRISLAFLLNQTSTIVDVALCNAQVRDLLPERLNLTRAETTRQSAGILLVVLHRLDAVTRGSFKQSVAEGGVIIVELAVGSLRLSVRRRATRRKGGSRRGDDQLDGGVVILCPTSRGWGRLFALRALSAAACAPPAASTPAPAPAGHGGGRREGK